MEEIEGQWVSIIEYASVRNISISTVRRYIKANRVKNKLDQGKYLIYLPSDSVSFIKKNNHQELMANVEALKEQIRILKEENNDLKMLVDLYEKDMREKTK
ncbi:MAG: hypothetical protein OEY33_08380 [Bdellovibrionales bacterium]|nr:hypothetical protein [Bdellovibrionales bacterium]